MISTEKVLRELRFWLQIMAEHALFLRLGLPCERQDLINEALSLESCFRALLSSVEGLDPEDTTRVRVLVQQAIFYTSRLINYKTKLLNLMLECKLGGFNFPLLIDHVRREAIRFVKILQHYLNQTCMPVEQNLLAEQLFWSRIMGDHARFISHLLDPSERDLIKTANGFAHSYDDLRLHAEDWNSMLLCGAANITPAALGRFVEKLTQETEKLRDFKFTAFNLISECKIVSLIPPLLADHVTREAEKFLQEQKEFALLFPKQ